VSDQKQIDELKKYIQDAETSLEAAKKALSTITGEDFGSISTPQVPSNLQVAADGKVIEGIFNGENMIGPEGKVFSVPANYASKSKLVEGDKMKLTVAEDGSFIFKQIGPVDRKKLVGTLAFEDNMYHVEAEGKKYSLLHASVTFHKAQPGDKVTIVVPSHGDSVWAAFENVIHDVAPTAAEPDPADTLNLDIPNEKPVPELEIVGASDAPTPVPEPAAPFPTDLPVEPPVSAEAPETPATPAPSTDVDPADLPDLEI
jgi:hypothetical protein